MPNMFNRPVGSRTGNLQGVESANPVDAVLKQQPGFVGRLRLNARQNAARFNVQRAAIEAMEEEALATTRVITSGQGALLRAEYGRQQAQVAAAIGCELVGNAAAAHVELTTARFGGSVANMRSRGDMLQEAEAIATALGLPPEEREALYATARALHLEAESMIDQAYQETSALVQREFHNATARAKALNENR